MLSVELLARRTLRWLVADTLLGSSIPLGVGRARGIGLGNTLLAVELEAGRTAGDLLRGTLGTVKDRVGRTLRSITHTGGAIEAGTGLTLGSHIRDTFAVTQGVAWLTALDLGVHTFLIDPLIRGRASGVVDGDTLSTVEDETLVTLGRSSDTVVTHEDRPGFAARAGVGDAGAVAGQAANGALGTVGGDTAVSVKDRTGGTRRLINGNTILAVEIFAGFAFGGGNNAVGTVKACISLAGRGVNAHTMLPFKLCVFGAGECLG